MVRKLKNYTVLRAASIFFSLYHGPQIHFFALVRSETPFPPAVVRFANPKKVLTSAKIRCSVRTLNIERPHLVFRCVSLNCVSLFVGE